MNKTAPQKNIDNSTLDQEIFLTFLLVLNLNSKEFINISLKNLDLMQLIKITSSELNINILVTNVVGLLLTPFIIKSLGDSEYGLYTLVGSFIAYFSLMDLGLNNTVIRFVAKYRTQKDKKGEEKCKIQAIYLNLRLTSCPPQRSLLSV